MTNESWDVRMDGDMVIAGLSERTREAYLRAVRQLAKFHRRSDPGAVAAAGNKIGNPVSVQAPAIAVLSAPITHVPAADK